MDPTEAEFKAALLKFKNRLSPTELEEFESTTLRHVQITIADIQKEQESVKTMRNMSRLRPFLEAMDQFGKVAEVYLNVHPIVAFVWGPMKLLLLTANTFVDSFDALLDAYQQIGDRLPLLQQYREIFQEDAGMRDALVMIYSDILEFHMRAMRFFKGKVWQKIFRSLWKDFDTRFKGILDNLRQHGKLIKSRAQLLHFQQYKQDSQQYRQDFQQYQHDLAEHREDIRKIRDQMENEVQERGRKKYAEVVQWISSEQTESLHEDFCKVRAAYPGTGSWVLGHEHVQNWRDADTPVSSALWLSGIPGAGKTVLASSIIESCKEVKPAATSYFYCSYVDQGRNTATAVMKGLLAQHLAQDRTLVPYCHERYLHSGEHVLGSVLLAKQLLETVCQAMGRQYIIIDGLDECDPPERKQIIDVFMSMVEKCDEGDPGKIRVLFVSQDFTDIKRLLVREKVTAKFLSLTPEDNAADIRRFIKDWATKIQRKFDLTDEQSEHFQNLTFINAHGMFLYAKLVMEHLHEQITRKQFFEEIFSKFPKTLNQAYERIMTRIEQNVPKEEWQVAQKLLGWMVCARRPLKWIEIQVALSIDADNRTIEFDDRRLRVHIHDICGSLVKILRGDRVELVHHTAKRYLESSQYEHIQVATVETSLTALCLQYLTFDCFNSEIDEDGLKSYALEGYFAFQDYAISKWFHHLRAMLDKGQEFLKQCDSDDDAQIALEDIEQALQDFNDQYETDLSSEILVDTSDALCEAFKELEVFPILQQIWQHIHHHQGKGSIAKNDVSIAALGEALTRNRKLIEELPLDDNMKTFYSEKRFKCPKLTCGYFHEGFKDAKSRDKHIDRHTRPFQCKSEDCLAAECGFSSNKELERHMRAVHPELCDQAELFSAPTTAVVKSQWRCDRCGKMFTRNFHLKNHIKSHNGERPHACPECGKAFTRLNDCKRHQKIHERGRR